jgi:hypothetical protein
MMMLMTKSCLLRLLLDVKKRDYMSIRNCHRLIVPSPTRIPRGLKKYYRISPDHTATKTFLWSKYSAHLGILNWKQFRSSIHSWLNKFFLEWREIYVTPSISQGYHQHNLRSEPYVFPNLIRMKRWHGTQLVLQEDVREVDYGRPMIHDRSLIEHYNLRKGQLTKAISRRDSCARLG